MQRRWLSLLSQAWRGWQAHDIPLLSAAIAFYAMLSLSPLLVVAVAVMALVIDPESASRYLRDVVAQVTNVETARFAQEVLHNTQRASSTYSAAGISLLLMLLGAARLFRQIKSALNVIWEAQAQGLRATVRGHLMAVLMVLVASIALLAWLGVDVVMQAVSRRITPLAVAWRWMSFAAGWALITMLFATAYRLLPDSQVEWRDVWVGAGIGALLFALCKLVVGIYLGFTSIQSVYGAASTAVVLLLWAYFSAQAFLFGAEWARAIWQERRPRTADETTR